MSPQTGSGMGGVAVGVLCAVMALLASGCTALPEAAPVTTAIVDPTLLVVAEEARAAGALSAGLLASPVGVRVSPQPASEKRPQLVPLKQAESAAAGAGAGAGGGADVGDVWVGYGGRVPAWSDRVYPLPSARASPLLRLTFDQVDAQVALQAIAMVAERNIVIAHGVTGKVSLSLHDVPWYVAMTGVLRVSGLLVQQQAGILWVAALDEVASLELEAKRRRDNVRLAAPLETRIFALNYARAKDVAAYLQGEGSKRTAKEPLVQDAAPQSEASGSVRVTPRLAGGTNQAGLGLSGQGGLGGLLSSRGVVIAETRTNQLFVSDKVPRMARIAAFIRLLDKPVRQVLIQARIVEADDGFSQSLGVRLSRHAEPIVQLPAVGLGGREPAVLALSLFRPGTDHLIALELTALEATGKGKIVSRPTIVTANLVKALIEQGTEYPYQSINANGSASVQFRKATLRLEVTPHVTPNGHVMLDVDIHKDSRGETTAQGVAINTKHVQTQVLVENTGTVVIGGIFERYDRNEETKVPFLGDLPGIGYLFKTQSERADRSEMLIFLTPYILKQDGAS